MTHHSLIEQSKPYIKQASSQTLPKIAVSLKCRTNLSQQVYLQRFLPQQHKYMADKKDKESKSCPKKCP